MAYNELYVINQALCLIGRQTVDSVDDDDQAALMSRRLLLLKPDFLKQATWNFAIVYREDANPVSPNFSPDYTYTYQLPANFGRIDRFSQAQQVFGCYYRIVDNLLLTNSNPVAYYYVALDADYSVFTPDAALALAYYVAAQTCLVLTNDEKLTGYLAAEYNTYFSKAVLSNDMERQILTTPYNDFQRKVWI